MNKLKIKLLFNRKGHTSSDGTAPIYIEVYKGGKNPIRKLVHTSILVNKNQWDDTKKLVVRHSQELLHNRILTDRVRAIEDYEFSLYQQGVELTPALLETFLSAKDNGSFSFFEFWDTELNQSNHITPSTLVSHRAVIKTLKEFRRDIRFQDIDYNLISQFDRFIRNKGLAQNTIAKYHKIIKTYINLAIKRKKYTWSSPYTEFKSKWVESDRVNLTYEQLTSIEQIQLPKGFPELELVKDAFLFSCYSGLRYNDVFSLKPSEVIDSNGELTVVKVMDKVNKQVRLPLHTLFDGKPERIIRKYLTLEGELVFKPMSNQHVNRLLKVIALMAKIPTRLTFHIARHTFGSMLAEATQNPYLIMDLMGHADIKTSMIYIHNSHERLNKQLRTVNWHKLDDSSPKNESEGKEVVQKGVKVRKNQKKAV